MNSFSEYLEQAPQRAWPEKLNLEALELSEEDVARDYEKMKRMYPREARFVAAMVEDLCDQLEYEGSPMFDEQPDSVTMYRMAEQVYTRMKGRDEGRPKPGHPLMQLCLILICNEFHMRRCRYHQRRRRFW